MSTPSAESFEYQLNAQPNIPGALSAAKVVLKNGPQTYKVASLLMFGDVDTGVVSREELRLSSYRRDAASGGYDFKSPTQSWSCGDSEIAALKAFLEREFVRNGQNQLVTDATAAKRVIERVRDGSVDAVVLADLAEALAKNADLATVLASSGAGVVLTEALTRARQAAVLDGLQKVIEDTSSTEPQIQKELEGEYWIFGGQYINQASRRSLNVRDQIDLPLIRQDGSLHIVELKRAHLPKLFRAHRSHLIVGDEVHEAVSQAMNYLRSLDEQRANIKADLGIDCRRSRATVVLGHFDQVAGGFTRDQMTDALRTYNSHLARVEVVTYDELLEGARRSLALTPAPGTSTPPSP